MSGSRDLDAAVEEPMAAEQPNYTGAIYGSLLAASVVVGAAAGAEGDYELPPVRLAALLVATGLVFWLAHAYARLVGDRVHHAALGWQEIRRVARHEWPLFQTALPPAGAALLFGLLGASNAAAAWAALAVAIVGQVGWATFTTIRNGAGTRLVLVTVLVNLLLGLLIVVLKAALHH
jgi:hypothetical protein